MAELQRSSSTPHVAPRAAARRPMALVMDADASGRSVLDVALSRDGFEVWSAGSPTEALRLLTGRVPEVIILGGLGRDEGFTFAATLRGEDRLSSVPVLLLAPQGERDLESLAEVMGVDVVLRKPVFARDVTALARLELARSGEGPLTFEAAELPPEQLLRALLSAGSSGRLLLAADRAELRFTAGRLVEARFGPLRDSLEAVVRALALTRGRYTVHLEPVRSDELVCRLRDVVERVVPRIARWQRALAKSLPLDTRLTIDFSRLAETRGLPDGVAQVLQLFDGFRTVETVLLDSPLNESVTLQAATRLFLMGVLAHAPGETRELVVLRPMPRLFEPTASEPAALMSQLFEGNDAERGGADAASSDWHELELARPRDDWKSVPVPEGLAEGLSPDVLRHLDAFQTPMQRDAREDDAPVPVAIVPPEDDAPIDALLPKPRRWPWVALAGGALLLAVVLLWPTPPAEPLQVAASPVEAPAPELPQQPEVAPVEVEPEAAAVSPVDVSEDLALATRLYERGQFKKAIAALEQVTAADPSSVLAWLQLGLARYDAGDARGARTAAEEVVRLEPGNARVQLLLATLRFDAQDTAGGRAALEKYLTLDPTGPHADEARALLR